MVVLSLYNESEGPLFVSRLTNVEFRVTGPDGKEVAWKGNDQVDSKSYSPSDFAVLQKYHELSVKQIISLKDGGGFVFDKLGQYSFTVKYSLEPPESFAQLAGNVKIPVGSFRSTKASFCIEACIVEPLPVHANSSQTALKAVRVFYTSLIKYRPLGIPEGRAKKSLWPLLGKRLTQELNTLEACDQDYYRRYGDILRANTYKSAIPWSEDGLFSGPNEAADVQKFAILSSRAIGKGRVDVHLRFTYGDPAVSKEHFNFDGVVTVILENNRWVVDDFVSMYENDELVRLSEGYPSDCKGDQWVGIHPY